MAGDKTPTARSLSLGGCIVVLAVAFLGWMFAGVQLAITSLAMRDAAADLLDTTEEARIASWFAWYVCAFLFGAAAGGLVFGRLGDLIGRAKAMGVSILCYSLLSVLAYFVQTPEQLLIVRFVGCMGIGGMWPNGIALVSEAWPGISRPFLAGVIGTAANVGIVVMSTIATAVEITPESWRWVMLVGAAPVPLGLFALALVPESPRWLAQRDEPHAAAPGAGPLKPISVGRTLWLMVIGIALSTVPLIGGWGSSNWVNPWASQVGAQAESPDPGLKARIHLSRSMTGSVGSLLGGWLASLLGRRRCYFLMSLAALGSAQYMFWFLQPDDPVFLFWAGALGFFSGVYFGWLPYCLPEMFPTRIRSMGAGVSFNFGRILTALTVFATGWLIAMFQGDYAQIGRVTSLIYAVGMIVILLAPQTTSDELED